VNRSYLLQKWRPQGDLNPRYHGESPSQYFALALIAKVMQSNGLIQQLGWLGWLGSFW
jgi:hypothetical protein